MGRVVIIAYKPKIGKEEALKKLVKTHWPRLRQQGLVTEKEAYSLETQDGTLVEVFEWLSDDAIKTAHKIQQYSKYGANMPRFALTLH